MADDEFLEEEGGFVDEEEMDVGGGAGTEFVPEAPSKAKPDIYSAILIITFCAFLVGIFLTGKELHENYDVNFWILSKEKPAANASAPK